MTYSGAPGSHDKERGGGRCMGTRPEPHDALPATATCPTDSGYCRNVRNPWPTNSGINRSNGGERALFHSFSGLRHLPCNLGIGVSKADDATPREAGFKDGWRRRFRRHEHDGSLGSGARNTRHRHRAG